MSNTQPFSWVSNGVTDVGKVRKINEDNLLCLPERGLWVVADRIGGHEAGDLASTTIVQYLQGVPEHTVFSKFVTDVEDRILVANNNLFAEAYQRGGNVTIGSTVVALMIFDQYAVFFWAGDSRIYRYRNNVYERITRDHSYVEDLVEQGLLAREDAESHPHANVITRAVGSAPDLFVDIDVHDIQDGDQFLLCSDGLYKDIMDEEMGEAMHKMPPAESSQFLLDLALERGASDNVTVTVVEVKAN